jgi:hypothetical protein
MEPDRELSSESLKFIEYMNSLPPALRPVYTTQQPNQSILLYEGDLEIVSRSHSAPILHQ